MSALKRLYDWTLSWSKSPYSAWGLFLIAFMESSFFPIPPDILLIPLILGDIQKWSQFASICTFGSVIGGILGYGIGLVSMETVGQAIIDLLALGDKVSKFNDMYNHYGSLIVLVGAFTPIPYKVITILSGAMRLNFIQFTLYSIIGRGGRFFLIAIFLRVFGEKVRNLIEKYFDLLTIIFVVILIVGFVFLKLL